MKKPKKSKMYFKEMEIACSCGSKDCGKLYIQFVSRNLIEVNFIPKGCKKVKAGVCISDKDLKKFRKLVIHQKEYDENFKELSKDIG